ncbi:F-box protein At3g07870 [Ricinus communis]|uniref:F-box domain-containing protein n=1 Tax=Ricinus communis TaxID=3988 RepID=B9RM84_RICCO|nr:F-box protein At3g07870 [Ricinus communis]EEF47407.1 hypothetical protein RCOM_1078540 [Ricinus communis]|eukprot:XP_002514853.1 F-box protein At3g07870 [Ricinus communis]
MECYISELPYDIIQKFFSNLPFKYLLQCRLVCKSWRDIIDAANGQFSRECSSTLLLFVETKTISVCEHIQECLKINMKSPLATVEKTRVSCIEILGKSSYTHCEARFNSGLNCRLKFVNSCNGLICLEELVPIYLPHHSNKVIRSYEEILRIVNPMTADYIILPQLRKKLDWNLYECVLGFCHKGNQYKAMRISYRVGKNRDRSTDDNWRAHVYTLGFSTGTWRRIENVPSFEQNSSRPFSNAFANGCFHWFFLREIMTFDFESEKFKSIPLPHHDYDEDTWINIGVLKDSIFISKHVDQGYGHEAIEIWLMKEYGAVESWVRVHVLVKTTCLRGCFEYLRIIKFFENGDLLLYNGMDWLLYHHEMKKYTRLHIPPGMEACFSESIRVEVIDHDPSFASLGDMMVGNNLKVSNARLRRSTL